MIEKIIQDKAGRLVIVNEIATLQKWNYTLFRSFLALLMLFQNTVSILNIQLISAKLIDWEHVN